VFDGAGRRVGLSARCLATGEEWVLGRWDRELDGPRHGRFSFSSAGVERAVECLRVILSRSPAGASPKGALRPVVVIDEIGPLEIEQGAGLAPVLPLLAGAGHLLLVARSSLTDRIEALVPSHRLDLVEVTTENRTSLAPFIDGLFD
jgi:nucleoside-triphosphatase THEP1